MYFIPVIIYLVGAMIPQLIKLGFIRISLNYNDLYYRYLPTIFIIGLLCMIYFFKNVELKSRNYDKKLAYLYGFYFAAIIIVIQMAAGIIIDGLVKNPYDQSLRGIMINLYATIPILLFRENVRSLVLNKNNKYSSVMFICVILLTTLPNISITGLRQAGTVENTVIYVAQYIFPIIMEAILLNLLAIYGGATASFIYVLLMELMKWIFPVQPSLSWLTQTVISAGVLGVLALAMNAHIEECRGNGRGRNKKNKSTGRLVMDCTVLSVAVVLIWFVVGVFPIYPSVVLTGSMKPGINEGDVVIIRKIHTEKELEKLKKGDIITFKRDDIVITHRIVEKITDTAGNITFKTKGDNNSVEDSRIVKANEVLGINIATVPKIGTPVLWIKGNIKGVPKGVEF